MLRRIIVCWCESGVAKIAKPVVENVCNELRIARVFVDTFEEVSLGIERTQAYCILYVGKEQRNLLEKLRGAKNGSPCRIVAIKDSTKFLDSNVSGDREILFPFNDSELCRLDLYQVVGKHINT